MKRDLLITLIICLVSTVSSMAQHHAFWAAFGLQDSKMSDLKYYQELILEDYPVPGKTTSSFPYYTSASVGFLKQMNPTLRIGAAYGFATTGGKSNYSDYTGYITTEFLANSYRLGGYVSYTLLDADWFELSVYGRFEVKYSLIDITQTFYALGYSDYILNKYGSISPGGSAGGEILFHVGDISFGVEGGYEADIPGKLSHRETKSDLTDPNDPNRVLTSDWTGWCAQLKVVFWFDN